MINIGSKISFQPKDFKKIPMDVLEGLGKVDLSIWKPVQAELELNNRSLANKIVRFGVSKKTKKWRESRAKKGASAETFRGSFNSVLRSPRVGRRTGVFLDTLRHSKPPGVLFNYSTNNEGSLPIINGNLSMEIDSSAFSYNYPNAFSKYLKRRGIVGRAGFTTLSKESERKIYNHLRRKLIK